MLVTFLLKGSVAFFAIVESTSETVIENICWLFLIVSRIWFGATLAAYIVSGITHERGNFFELFNLSLYKGMIVNSGNKHFSIWN